MPGVLPCLPLAVAASVAESAAAPVAAGSTVPADSGPLPARRGHRMPGTDGHVDVGRLMAGKPPVNLQRDAGSQRCCGGAATDSNQVRQGDNPCTPTAADCCNRRSS